MLMSRAQVVDNIQQADKKEATSKTKAIEKVQRDKEKEETKRQSDAVKQAKKEAKNSSVPSHQEGFLLSGTHAGFKAVQTFSDQAAFVAAKTASTYDFTKGEPYMVESYETLSKMTEERGVKASVGLFRIQYSAVACKEGHRGFGTTSFLGDQKGKLRELCVDLAPAALPHIPETEAVFKKSIESVHLYANSVGNSVLDIERQGLAQMRFQVQGEKAFSIIKYDLVAELTGADGATVKRSDEDIFEYHKRLLHALNQSSMDVVHAKGLAIFRGTLKPGGILCVPSGCYLCEKTLGATMTLGFRSPFIDTTPASRESFSAFSLALKAISPDHPLGKYWEKTLPFTATKKEGTK